MQLFMLFIDSNAQLSIKSIKSCISLVIYMIFIYKDARSHEHKIQHFKCNME